VFAIDKNNAIKNKRRIRENTLHLLCLSGGWPGAILAIKLLRHKSSKLSFKTVLFFTILTNCTIVILIYKSIIGL